MEYSFGGYNSGGIPLGSVQRAKINTDGTFEGDWSTEANSLLIPRCYHSSVVYNGYLYVLGGSAYNTSWNVIGDVEYTKIQSDGILSNWAYTSSFAGSDRRYGLASAACNGYLYMFGGWGPSENSLVSIQYASINADGSLSNWAVLANSLGTARGGLTAEVYNGYLYALGGQSGTSSSGAPLNSAEYTTINTPAAAGYYSKLIDLGEYCEKINSILINGTADYNGTIGLSYKIAPADTKVFGAMTTVNPISLNSSIDLGGLTGRYLWLRLMLDDTNTALSNPASTNQRDVTDIVTGFSVGLDHFAVTASTYTSSVGSNVTITITAKNAGDATIAVYTPTGEVTVSAAESISNSSASLSKTTLTAEDFSNGIAVITLTDTQGEDVTDTATDNSESKSGTSLPITFNTLPSVSSVSGLQTAGSSNVVISYTAVDAESHLCSIDQAEYSTNGTSWFSASISGTTSGITASSTGIAQNITWVAPANISDATVFFRIRLNDGYGTGGYTASLGFAVDTQAPTGVRIVSPADSGIVSSNPVITAASANDISAGLQYYFQLAKDTNFTVDVQNSGWQAGETWALTGLTAHITYYARVKVKDMYNNESGYCGPTADTAGYTSFTVNSLPSVSAVSGIQSAVDGSRQITINYTAVDADSDSCSITGDQAQYSIDSTDGINGTWNNGVISGTTSGITATPTGVAQNIIWTAPAGIDDTTVFFRIKLNDGYGIGDYTPSSAFSVDTKAPTNVRISVPVNNATGISYTPTITANSANDTSIPVQYKFELATDTGFTQNKQTRDYNSSSSWEPGTALNIYAEYYVRVAAKDAYGNESVYCGSAADTAGSTHFTTLNNYSPGVSSVEGSQSTDGSKQVTIEYTATDTESDNSNLTASIDQVQYSFDNTTWYNAAVIGGAGITTGIATLPSGVNYSNLIWQAGSDAGSNTEDTTVYFRLKLNDSYSTGSYGSSSAFLLDTKAPTNAAISSPANNAANVSVNPTITADTAVDLSSVQYKFELATDTGFTQNKQTRDYNSSVSWQPAGLAINTTYYARVMVKDAYGNESGYCGSVPDQAGYTTKKKKAKIRNSAKIR